MDKLDATMADYNVKEDSLIKLYLWTWSLPSWSMWRGGRPTRLRRSPPPASSRSSPTRKKSDPAGQIRLPTRRRLLISQMEGMVVTVTNILV